ncbi:hypothetical protein BBP40_001547 [Aspergillus hancockii]|nr:hypothetical protein BBP40_001547 [Aspergillus hancockii]
MSTTTPAPSATSTCHQKLYDIPIKDAACAMPINGNNSAIMTSCCGSASVVSYGSCDYYCLAQDQSVGDLAECLIKASKPGEVWCNTNANATATGSVPTTGAGTIVATASATGSTKSGTKSSSGSSAASTNGAVGKQSIGVLAILVFGAAAGLFV